MKKANEKSKQQGDDEEANEENVDESPDENKQWESNDEFNQAQATAETEDADDGFVMKIVGERCRNSRAEVTAAALAAGKKQDENVQIIQFLLDTTESTALDESGVSNFSHGIPGAHAVDGTLLLNREDTTPGAHAMPGTMGREGNLVEETHTTSDFEDSAAILTEDGTPEQVGLERPIDGAVLVATTEGATEEAPHLEDGGSDVEVLEGRILEEQKQHVNRRVLVTTMAVLLCGGLVAVLALVLPPKKPNEGPVKITTTSDLTSTVNPPFREHLPLDVVNTIFEVGSSYHLANAWMIQDPYLDTYSTVRQMTRFYMVSLYYILNGHAWIRNDHWLSYEVSNCDWFLQNSSTSIHGWNIGDEAEPTCDEDGNLRVMNLTSNNLQGTMPETTQDISPFLKIFDLSDNDIHGQPLSFTGGSMDLEVVNLSNNNFEGQLRGGALTPYNMRIVKLDGNRLLGYSPIVYRYFPKLEVLNLAGNLFNQYLTEEHIHNRNLTYLLLADNYFKGSLPSVLGVLTGLVEIDVSGNSMVTGTVPSELGLLSHLSLLDLSGTSINGTIPESMCERVNEQALIILANCSLVRCCK